MNISVIDISKFCINIQSSRRRLTIDPVDELVVAELELRGSRVDLGKPLK